MTSAAPLNTQPKPKHTHTRTVQYNKAQCRTGREFAFHDGIGCQLKIECHFGIPYVPLQNVFVPRL